MTLRLMTLSISIECHNAENRLFCYYSDCRYAEYHDTEFYCAKYHNTEFYCAEYHNTEFYCAECQHTEIRCGECWNAECLGNKACTFLYELQASSLVIWVSIRIRMSMLWCHDIQHNDIQHKWHMETIFLICNIQA